MVVGPACCDLSAWLRQYADYDVVSDQGTWKSGNAFKLTGMDGKLYGRGVIDNKGVCEPSAPTSRSSSVVGPILAVATAAADLLEAGELGVDLLMLLEGEEETVRCEAIKASGAH